MSDDRKHDICAKCGHYRFLHKNFGGMCDACDSPEYPPEKRCVNFAAVPELEHA